MSENWPKNFVSEENLRREIELVLDCVKRELFKTFGKNNVVGIYFMGSAAKKWDSPIDYVPEVSDVDVHVLVKNTEFYYSKFNKIEDSLSFGKSVEKNFFKRIKKPFHVPMIQVLCLNEMHSETGYLPSAASTVKCIYGKAYPGLNKKLPELFLANRAKLQILENESLFKKLIKRSLYKYSHHLDKYLADLSWRISSSGANFLCMKGVPYETAFALNKSGVRKKMQELGFNDLARNYYNFYFCAWKNFMTKNPQDCRKSIIAGYYALEIMVKEARKV